MLQEIAAAVKLEYGASRAGYALEVYLALQRLQTAAAGEAVVEAEDVQTLLDDLRVSTSFAPIVTYVAVHIVLVYDKQPPLSCLMQDHCWSYILRNWHLLQRTSTFKTTLPADTRQRLSDEVKDSLVNITSLESPGNNTQSTGFSVLWDASNTQDGTAGANTLGPDGKRPVSKATEKRRQRMLEQQQQQQQLQEPQQARSAKLKQSRGTVTSSGKANAVAGSGTAQCSTATPCADPLRQPVGLPSGGQLPNPDAGSLLPGQIIAAPARQPANATQQSGSTASSAAQPARRGSRPSRDLAEHPGLDTGGQSAGDPQRNGSRRQSAPDVAAARPRLQREPNQARRDRPSSSLPKPALPRRGAAADSTSGSSSASLHKTQSVNAREASADMRLGNSGSSRERQETASSQTVQEGSAQDNVNRLSQLQQMRRLSLESKPRFR